MSNSAAMDRTHHFQISIAELGEVTISWSESGLIQSIQWSSSPGQSDLSYSFSSVLLMPLPIKSFIFQLKNYFSQGEPIDCQSFQNLFDWSVCTDFQKGVFLTAQKIPTGETRTYAWIASQMRMPFSARAVGQALKRNPFLVYVPCHRVVSSTSLGGFMGKKDPNAEEIKLKKVFLDLEFDYHNPRFSFLWTPACT